MSKLPIPHIINTIKTKLGFDRAMTAPGEDVVDAVNKQSAEIDGLQAADAYVENGDTAQLRTYAAGDFIMWKGVLYTVNSEGITQGTAITGHVTEVSNGGFNNLLGLVNKFKHGIILGSDIGDIPANSTNFEITIPSRYFISGSFIYYGAGDSVNWLVRSIEPNSITIRIKNNTNIVITASTWRFKWFAIEP